MLIENGVLKSGDDVRSVVVPDGVYRLGVACFYDDEQLFEQLEEVILPEGLLEIGGNAFAECKSLKRIVLPSSVETLGEFAFWNCTSLEYISIPSSVKVIPENCFCGCSALSQVDLHEGLIEIEDSAFDECPLTELKIPYGTQRLGDLFEFGSDSLSRVYIPETVVEIDESAFAIYGLEIHVQKNSFAHTWAKQQMGMYKIIEEPASTFTAKETTMETATEPYIRNQSELVAFLDSSCSTITVPQGIEIIGPKAFASSDIERIDIPEAVTKISRCAFGGCKKLREVIIRGNNITIEEGAFANCSNLQRIILFAKDATIADGIFIDPALKQLSLVHEDDNCCFYCLQETTVVKYALRTNRNFAYIDAALAGESIDRIVSACNSLSNPIIPLGVLSIEGDTLVKCAWPKLQEDCTIALPDMITHIADGVFCGAHLTEVILPKGLKSIGKEAFKHSRISKIIIPDSVEHIGEAAFAGCHIQEITLPPIRELPASLFQDCCDLVNASLPDSLMKIGASAFANCIDLKGISLPKCLIEIGANAFAHCYNLLYITIPDSVVDIADNAFFNCFKCVFLCNQSSFAREYADKHFKPARTYSDTVVTNLQKREELEKNNKSVTFHYQGSSITVPSNYAVYHKMVQQYTPKAKEIYSALVQLCEKLICDDRLEPTQTLAELERITESVNQDLQSVGIYLQDAKGHLFSLNPAVHSIYSAVTVSHEFVLELYQNAVAEISDKRDIFLAQAESKVTGLSYGIITSSALTLTAYALDDYFERISQRQAAAQQLRAQIEQVQEEELARVRELHRQFMDEGFKPAIKKLSDQFIQELLDSVATYLEQYDILPEKSKDLYDYDKASRLLSGELLSSYQKGVILGKALAYCPYNLDVYRQIIDLGLADDVVYQVASCVGIEKEVLALKEKITAEKQQRSVIEEQRRREEEQRRQAEERRSREAAIEQARAEKKRNLEEQIRILETELSNIKGLFTGKRKAAIRQKIEELENELKSI